MDPDVYARMAELETTHWWFRARRQIIECVIRRIVMPKPGAKLLEAGCGSGGNLSMLAGFGTVDAFEFDDTARQIAADRAGHDIPFGALPDNIPFADDTYDIIGMFDVLEHVDPDEASLIALKDRLSPDGTIVITVPAFPRLWSRHDETHHHFRRYTRASLTKVANAAGLSVHTSFYFNWALFPLAMTVRGLKRLTGSNTPDDKMPAPWLNGVLYRIFASEQALIGRVKVPFGLSLCAVLKSAQ